MENNNIEVIYLLVQTNIAFVAFATIVATLSQSFGKKLKPYQYLLFRFFVDVGLLHVLQMVIVAMFFDVFDGRDVVWFYSACMISIMTPLYMASYFQRRRKIKGMLTPPISKFVTVGFLGFVTFTWWTVSGFGPTPSLFTIASYFVWSLWGVVAIFLYFLGTFIDVEKDKIQEDSARVR